MTQRQTYRIVNPQDLADLTNQLNALLVLLMERLDRIEGFRGTGLKINDDSGTTIHGMIKE